MQKFWRSKEFETLKKEWAQRLKESGFEDIEREVEGEWLLRQPSDYAHRRKEHTHQYRESKLDYFLLLAECLSSNPNFDDESDYIIMLRTSEGWQIGEISEELKSLGREKYNRDTIRYIRRRYEDRWGIRSWNKEEMVSRRVRIR